MILSKVCIDISAKAFRQFVVGELKSFNKPVLSLPISNCLSADGHGARYITFQFETMRHMTQKRRSSAPSTIGSMTMLMMMGGWSVSGPYTTTTTSIMLAPESSAYIIGRRVQSIILMKLIGLTRIGKTPLWDEMAPCGLFFALCAAFAN